MPEAIKFFTQRRNAATKDLIQNSALGFKTLRRRVSQELVDFFKTIQRSDTQ